MIKNLKIYRKAKENTKFKLNRIKVGVIAIGLSCVMLFGGCGSSRKSYSDLYDSIKTTSTTQEQVVETYDYDDYTTEDVTVNDSVEIVDNNDILSSEYISINETSTAILEDYINNMSTYYEYSELFNTEAALERYENNKFNSNVEHEYDLLKGSKTVDADDLYDVVVVNNKEYLEEFPSSLYKNLSKKETKKICEIVANTINSYIASNPSIDLEELSCTLGNLKIYSKTTSSNAYVSTDGCLAISPNMLNILQMANEDVDTYTATIAHETIHLIQRSCDDIEKENNGKNIGISYKWDDFDVNPLDFNWFYESSAEKCSNNYTNQEPLVYKTMVSYLESLSMSTILDDNVKVNQTENMNLTKNLDDLFNQFGCTTKEEKIEIINMMMSINIIQTEPDDFTKKYETVYGKTLDTDEYAKVKCTIKASVVETLSKYFYRNLAETVKNNNTSLQDIFYLIKTFENDINGHIKYTNDSYKDYNESFVNNYVGLQQQFFYILSQNSNYKQEEIEEMFNSYSPISKSNGNEVNNCSLEWLSNDKKEYILDFSKDVLTYNGQSIASNLTTNYSSKQLQK